MPSRDAAPILPFQAGAAGWPWLRWLDGLGEKRGGVGSHRRHGRPSRRRRAWMAMAWHGMAWQ